MSIAVINTEIRKIDIFETKADVARFLKVNRNTVIAWSKSPYKRLNKYDIFFKVTRHKDKRGGNNGGFKVKGVPFSKKSDELKK